MNLARLQELNNFDHMAAVEVEHEEGWRMWVTCRDSEVSDVIDEYRTLNYGLSDLDHHAKCECLASWDEWMFLLDIQRMMA